MFFAPITIAHDRSTRWVKAVHGVAIYDQSDDASAEVNAELRQQRTSDRSTA
jgi:hypothetical protein